MACTSRSAKASLSPMKRLAGPKKIQKHKSAKSILKVSCPGSKKLTRPKKIQNYRKGPKLNTDEIYEIDFEGNFPVQTQPHEAPGLPMTNDTEVQSSPVPIVSLKRKVKGRKKVLRAASGKKNNATAGEEHYAADAEEQVVEGPDLKTNEVNADIADHTVVIAAGSTRSAEKPLPTPLTKQSKHSAQAPPTRQLNRKPGSYVTICQ